MEYILLNAVPILIATGAGFLAGVLLRAAVRAANPAIAGPAAALSPAQLVAIGLAQAWLAAILAGALILAPSEAGAWTMAIGSAVVIWIGFVVPATIVNHAYRGLGPAAIGVDTGWWLAVMITQAVVLKAIGLVPPPA